jgi:hypothetical protein
LEILLAEDEEESPEVLIDTIEDRAIYPKLEKFGVDMVSAKAANFTHKQLLFLRTFLERYRRRKVRKSLSADRETDPPFLLLIYTNEP